MHYRFIDKILIPKPVVSTVPKNDLVIALLYVGKLPLQIPVRINHIMKNNSCTVVSDLFSRLSAKLVTLCHLKTKFHRSYVLVLFTNFGVVAAILPIMAKLSVILTPECVKTWEFLHSL